MDAVADATPLASFEAKWVAAHPEFGLALRFVGESGRRAQSAFACLVYELEHAAFGIREAQPAAIKLQWWAEEFARAAKHEARHPLTQALAEHPGFAAVPLALWYEVIAGALAQRDPEPAADRAALLDAHAVLYRPLGAIEAALFPSVDAAASARVRALARSLRDTATLADALRDGRLPLPLDLLARHRLARGDLARTSAQQVAALREWLRALASEHAEVAASGAHLGVLVAANLHADRWRARKATRAEDPLATLNAAFGQLPFDATWAAWRTARRSSR
ncbi:squalene/phytoene synthase family protein [Dokdonella soli]|uniref:Phytoene synthase n=1 Tax=Dokdonella soli TaxID=529810 RepID=A0ABP3TKW2_9GAMM